MINIKRMSSKDPTMYNDCERAIRLLQETSLSMKEIWQRCAPDVPYYWFILELQCHHCKSFEMIRRLQRRVCGKMQRLFCRGKGTSTRIGHKSSGLKVGTAHFVELCPVACLTAWREALCKATISKSLEGGVYPPKAESLLHNINVGDYPLHRTLTA